MALTDEGNGFYMPVAPAYAGNNGGFGGGWGNDWAWIIILLLAFNGGWGNGFGGGMGGYDFPWLLNGQNNINANTNSGFRDAMLQDSVTSVRDGISGLSTQLCGCCGDMQMAVANGFSNAEIAANGRQMANMQQAFNSQTAITGGLNNLSSQFANCCCENRLGIANLAADVARENCADREALNYGVRDIINNQTAGIQRILDKLCDQELQAERRDNANLRSELMFARGQASQAEQTAIFQQGLNNEVDALYNRLSNCPVPSVPVYGRQPIFTCNNGCGCGCGNM
jgi:hypothetical protein